jgi:hypothetical protein
MRVREKMRNATGLSLMNCLPQKLQHTGRQAPVKRCLAQWYEANCSALRRTAPHFPLRRKSYKENRTKKIVSFYA